MGSKLQLLEKWHHLVISQKEGNYVAFLILISSVFHSLLYFLVTCPMTQTYHETYIRFKLPSIANLEVMNEIDRKGKKLFVL